MVGEGLVLSRGNVVGSWRLLSSTGVKGDLMEASV